MHLLIQIFHFPSLYLIPDTQYVQVWACLSKKKIIEEKGINVWTSTFKVEHEFSYSVLHFLWTSFRILAYSSQKQERNFRDMKT